MVGNCYKLLSVNCEVSRGRPSVLCKISHRGEARLEVEMTRGVAVWWTVEEEGLPQSAHGSVLSHLKSV